MHENLYTCHDLTSCRNFTHLRDMSTVVRRVTTPPPFSGSHDPVSDSIEIQGAVKGLYGSSLFFHERESDRE